MEIDDETKVLRVEASTMEIAIQEVAQAIKRRWGNYDELPNRYNLETVEINWDYRNGTNNVFVFVPFDSSDETGPVEGIAERVEKLEEGASMVSRVERLERIVG